MKVTEHRISELSTSEVDVSVSLRKEYTCNCIGDCNTRFSWYHLALALSFDTGIKR